MLICLLSLNLSAFAAEIYRFVDSNGTIHFTDSPPLTSSRNRPNKAYKVAVNTIRIYKFTDHKGTVHLTDQPVDSRYKLIYQGHQTIGTFSGGRYSARKMLHKKYVKYADVIQDAAYLNGLQPALVHAVIQAESAYNPKAKSPKGAVGLMQLMPGTAKRYGVKDRTDASDNIGGGTRYLKDLLEMFDYDTKLALAAYNAGENAVIRYGNKIPPYKETKHYVKTVMKLYGAYSKAM